MKIYYPYTCPHYRQKKLLPECIHYDSYLMRAIGLKASRCELGRDICYIALDMSYEGVPTTTEDILKNLDCTPEEMETIRVSVDQFFRAIGRR